MPSKARKVRVNGLRNKRSQYSPTEAQVTIVEMLRRAKLFDLASRISKCGSNEQPFYCESGNAQGTIRYYCREALCPTCRFRKAFKVSKEVERVVRLMQENAPGTKALLFTLTVPSCDEEDLKGAFTHLAKSFVKLTHQPELKAFLLGCVRVMEIRYNRKTGMFQPHLHALMLVRSTYFSKKGNYLSRHRLLKLWQKVTRRSDITEVDILVVRANKRKETSFAQEAATAVRYAQKPLLPDKWTPHSLAILSKTLHRRRCYEFLGDCRTAKKMSPRYKRPCFCEDCQAQGAVAREKKDTTPLEVASYAEK